VKHPRCQVGEADSLEFCHRNVCGIFQSIENKFTIH